MSKWKTGLLGTALVAAIAVPAVAFAQGNGDDSPEPEQTTPETTPEPVTPDPGHDDLFSNLENITDDLVAEINAGSEELAQALRDAGINVTMETKTFSVTYPTWDEADNEAASGVVDRFFDGKFGFLGFEEFGFGEHDFGDFGFGESGFGEFGFGDFGFGPFEPSPEDVEFFNEKSDALAAHFDAAGIAYTFETDESGLRWIDWDFDDEAANAAAEEFFKGQFGELADFSLPGKVVEKINGHTEELAQALEDAGISVTMVEGPDGVTYPEWAEADDAAAEAVIRDLVMDRFGISGIGELLEGFEFDFEWDDDLAPATPDDAAS